MKRRRVTRPAPFNRIGKNLGLLLVDEAAAESVVVRSARRRIEVHRLLNLVDTTARILDRSLHFIRETYGRRLVGRSDILLVLRVSGDAPLAVVGGVLKIHRCRSGLIVVVAPTVK